MYYFLSNINNPTRYTFLVYNYYTASQFAEVIQNLDQHRVKYVLWDKGMQDKVIDVLFPSAHPKHLIMEPYLESHYKPIWVHDGVLLMERNDDDPAPVTMPSGNSSGALRNNSSLGAAR
jgi:hypothetical protein